MKELQMLLMNYKIQILNNLLYNYNNIVRKKYNNYNKLI